MKWLLITIIMIVLPGCDQGIESQIYPVSQPDQTVTTPLGTYGVMVKIQPVQGVKQLNLVYNIDGGSNEIVEMSALGDGLYQGVFPGQPFGHTVLYFIYGETESGDELRYPAGEKITLSTAFIRSVDFVCSKNSDCYHGEGCIRGSCKLRPEICSSDLDCPVDENCNINGDQQCAAPVSSCNKDEGCNSGFYCHNGGCLPLGDRCDLDRDCRIGQQCGDDGYCRIGIDCSSDGDCDETAYCHPDIARCVLKPECTTRSDCSDPMICNTVVGRCVARVCTTHFECDHGQRCDLATGICILDAAVECYHDDECGGEKPYCDLLTLKCEECVKPFHCPQGETCFENSCYGD